MRPITALTTAATAAALLLAAPTAAHARPGEVLDKNIYDSTPEISAGTWHAEGAAFGDLGYRLDVTVTAVDGTLTTGSNLCEPADVSAVLTLAEGGTLTVRTTGSFCTGFYGNQYVDASFGTRQATYEGTTYRRVRIVGDGHISAAAPSYGGLQAGMNASVAWQ